MAQATHENQAPVLADDQPPEHRYLTGRHSHASAVRPKTFSWSPTKMSKLPLLTCPDLHPQRSARLRPHQARYLAQKLDKCQYGPNPPPCCARPRPPCRGRRALLVEGREGLDLAAGVSELEERQARWQAQRDADLDGEAHRGDGDGDDEVARLYRLGLLYDDEHERGSGFNLDAITHDDAPAYSLNVEGARRRSRRKCASAADDEALAVLLAEADYVDVNGGDLFTPLAEDGAATPRQGVDVVEAVRLQHRLWAAFRGHGGSDADEGEWEML